MGDIIMSDLLKEAIADAKAVRETALQNAKMALEEAFTPHLKSMLSAKLAEDEIEEDEDVYEGEHEEDEDEDDEMGEMSSRPKRDDEDDEDPEEGMHDDGEESSRREDDDDEEEVDEGEIIEIDGVKYAPVVSEEEHEDEEDEEVDESEELDLEAVIKELEEELEEAGDPGDEEESVNEGPDEEEEKVEEEVVTEDDDEDDEKDEVDEQSTSSGIGKGTSVKMASASDEEDPGKGKKHESVDKLQGELKEYKEAVSFLRDKLHEVNILNAKLLYTNKLFKEYVLSNDQKLKIVETFDRAQTTREIKLVYSTLAESYKDNGGERKEVVKESYASKKSGGTAPKTKIITEESQVADRFRKLAGLKS
tara:strand:- start:154 stop:1245 length:1092 start_codon:yes stop_codon:yes gene_type:complete